LLLPPAVKPEPLKALGTVIWLVFILNFVVELVLAPRKLDYLKGNWLMALSLLLPALKRSHPEQSPSSAT